MGETCWKLESKVWFRKEGTRAGSAQSHISRMAKAHARNANYLLNVGPDKDRKIIESSLKTLAEIGRLRKAEADEAEEQHQPMRCKQIF